MGRFDLRESGAVASRERSILLALSAEEVRDVELVVRAAVGDREAFAALFERHASVVLGVLVRMLRRREVAEEILQEVFLQAWQRAGGYRPERATPRGWLLMMARSRAIDWLRSSGAQSRREQTVYELDLPQAEMPSAPRELESAERRARVGDALGGLPPEQRDCIRMAFFEGLSHSQVAARLGQPLGTVKSRILLGMNKMREALRD